MNNMSSYFSAITFANQEAFFLLIGVALAIVWYIFKVNKRTQEVNISGFDNFKNNLRSYKQNLIHLPFSVRILALCFLIFALARPQSSTSWQDVTTEGIDIVLAMDISASMLAQDLKPNRIEASKKLAINFIEERINDRIGLVIFSGEAFTQCPLTTDHAILKNLFMSVKTGMVADGTAIGMGLATAVNRIKGSTAKSKVVILLTDGVNNSGNIAPETAAEIAKTLGVRVYTIGVGTKGVAYSPVGMYPDGSYAYDYVEVKIDDELLTKVAEQTGGKYYRATNNKQLANVYKEIDKLEKSKIEVSEFRKRKEEFFLFALIGAGLLLFEFILKYLIIKKLP